MEDSEFEFDGSLQTNDLFIKMLNYFSSLPLTTADIKSITVRTLTEEERGNIPAKYNAVATVNVKSTSEIVNSQKQPNKLFYYTRLSLSELNRNVNEITILPDNFNRNQYKESLVENLNTQLNTTFEINQCVFSTVSSLKEYKVALKDDGHSGAYGYLTMHIAPVDPSGITLESNVGTIHTQKADKAILTIRVVNSEGVGIEHLSLRFSFPDNLTVSSVVELGNGFYKREVTCNRVKNGSLTSTSSITLTIVNEVTLENKITQSYKIERTFKSLPTGNGEVITASKITEYLLESESISFASWNGMHLKQVTLPSTGTVGECVRFIINADWGTDVILNGVTTKLSRGTYHYICNSSGKFVKQ